MPRDIIPIQEALDSAVRAAEQYGAAVANHRPLTDCQLLMNLVKEQSSRALMLIRGEFSRKFEAGIEIGRQQAIVRR